MHWLVPLCHGLGGAVLANAVPHFISGMMGRPFQSPFAKPPGRGLSSPTVNALWGFVNLVVGYLLVCRVGSFDLKNDADAGALGAGVLLMALLAARHFGGLQGGAAAERP